MLFHERNCYRNKIFVIQFLLSKKQSNSSPRNLDFLAPEMLGHFNTFSVEYISKV
jgi:hypothetical protein